ncbi:MAG: metallophosphoesterase family protein [Candidatus Auribacterota bacterium]
MKYAILSDIHGNIDALNSVVADCKNKNVDKYLCLGDIVGYGASPAECIKKIRSLDAVCVMGNHDHAVVGLTDISYFNSHAKAAAQWTADVLSEEDLAYLKNLPFIVKIEEASITLVHSTLESPEMWHYMLSDIEADRNLKKLDTQLCFIGHSHMPAMFQEQYNSKALFDFLNHITIRQKTIVNVGSVGQPRDNNPRASYVLYDSDEKIVYFERVEYNIKSAQKKIIKAGLPKILATRLEMGK